MFGTISTKFDSTFFQCSYADAGATKGDRVMSTKSLPTSASLTQLKNQATDLLSGQKAGDVSVCARIRLHFPKLNEAPNEAILQFNFVLQNA